MFGELPKLFDRNFAVGFFLPVATFITLSGWVLGQYGFGPDLGDYFGTDLIVGTTILGVASWVGGIILLAINRDLYRILEGYGTVNPFQVFTGLEKRRYHGFVNQVTQLEAEYRACIDEEKEFPLKSRANRNRLIRLLAKEFPDKEEYILPTAFGNVLRSFETYPRVMYGLDSIDAWERLLSVIPKDYRELIDAAKAQVDFWVNLGLAFVLLLVEYEVLALTTGTPLDMRVILLLISAGTLAALRATNSADAWGDFVKSAYDVYRFRLLEVMGIDLPKDRDEEKSIWRKYSQAITYRLPDALPALKKNDAAPPRRETIATR